MRRSAATQMTENQNNDAGCFRKEATGRSHADQWETWLSVATERGSAKMAVRMHRPEGLSQPGAQRAGRDTSSAADPFCAFCAFSRQFNASVRCLC